MRLKLTLGTLLCLLSGMSTVLMSQAPERFGTPDQTSIRNAVDLVRKVNTAEADVFMSQETYVALDKLLQHRFFTSIQPASKSPAVKNVPQVPDEGALTLVDSSSGKVNNYAVYVVVSPDGKHYQVAMIPMAPRCASAVFSNQTGVIYMAEALGCSPDKIAGSPSVPTAK